MSNPGNPLRRTHNLTVQRVGDETLIYDETRHLAFCLDSVASTVWDRCDGARSIEEIAATASLKHEQVVAALERLGRESLLDMPAGISRRVLMLRAGTGAAMALPMIAMITAPAAAQVYSGCANCGGPNVKQKVSAAQQAAQRPGN